MVPSLVTFSDGRFLKGIGSGQNCRPQLAVFCGFHCPRTETRLNWIARVMPAYYDPSDISGGTNPEMSDP